LGGDWNEKEVFLVALSLNPEDRSAYLEKACADSGQRSRIEALLLAHAQGATNGTDSWCPAEPRGPLPERFDEFEVIRPLGEGGMGRVYLALDTILGRQVALKVLSGGSMLSADALNRFREEARSAASLRHPGIVPVHKFGVCEGRHYIVSEFVDGPTLGKVIAEEIERRKGPWRTSDAREWRLRAATCVAAVADALDHSHRAGIIHRDVKPSNIIIDPELGPRLADFGIAKRLAGDSNTGPMDLLGSCHYMSPEQASLAAQRVDQRSDVFSLGVVLYEMLTLRRPFDGEDVPRVLKAVVSAQPARLRTVDPTAPKSLETICLKALEKSPDHRYQSAAHLAADLRCFVAGRPIMARPPGRLRRVSRWALARRTSLLTTAAAALVAALGFVGWRSRDAALERDAWFTVTSPEAGSAVFVQHVDPETLELGPAVLMGRTPLKPCRVTPGQCRITLVAPDMVWFAEFNALLFRPGRSAATKVVVSEPGGAEGAPGEDFVLRAAAVPSPDVGSMSLVPGGEYPFGWSDTGAPMIVGRVVRLDAFYIDHREVSNAEYHEFVRQTGHPPPAIWARFGFDPATADLPVVGLTVADAEAYARWRGKRLPTAHEWQAAARGATGRLSPLIEDPQLSDLFVEPQHQDLIDYGSTDAQILYDLYRRCSLPVGEGVSDEIGLFHTFGNVREFSGTVGSREHGVAIMGRSWIDSPSRSTLALVNTSPIEHSSILHGFRCARSAAPPVVAPLSNAKEK